MILQKIEGLNGNVLYPFPSQRRQNLWKLEKQNIRPVRISGLKTHFLSSKYYLLSEKGEGEILIWYRWCSSSKSLAASERVIIRL